MSNGCATIVRRPSCGSMPFFVERGEQLELVAAEPDADLLALHSGDVGDAGVLPGDLGHPAPREHLGDVDDVPALVAGGEQVRSQSMPNSAWPPRTTCSGMMSGPPGLIVTSRLSSS